MLVTFLEVEQFYRVAQQNLAHLKIKSVTCGIFFTLYVSGQDVKVISTSATFSLGHTV